MTPEGVVREVSFWALVVLLLLMVLSGEVVIIVIVVELDRSVILFRLRL